MIKKYIVVRMIRFVLVVVCIASFSGCTTTTKKLSKTERPVDQEARYIQARDAFSQKNYEVSISLLKPLAEQGHTEAQYALGYMYYNGQGVSRNYKQAIYWLSIADAKGNKKATEALRRLALVDEDAAGKKQKSEPITTPVPVEAPAKPPVDLTESVVVSGETKSVEESMQPNNQSPEKPVEEIVTPKPAVAFQESTQALAQQAEPIQKNQEVQQIKPVEKSEVALNSAKNNSNVETTARFTDGEQWILSQPSVNYTIQLIGTDNEAALKNFINKNNLGDSAVYYKTENKDGSIWFTLIQGSFETTSEARNAIEKLSVSLQKKNPWVKPISSIQNALSAR